MKKYYGHGEYERDNRQNAYRDPWRADFASQYDALYVPLFDPADLAELGGMVRRLRKDDLTLHFANHVEAPNETLKDAIEREHKRTDELSGFYYMERDMPDIRFHAIYVLERMLDLMRLTDDAGIEAFLLRRMTDLLNKYKPPSCLVLRERTSTLFEQCQGSLFELASKKFTHILSCMMQDATQLQRLQSWMALVGLFVAKRAEKAV